MPTRYDEQPHAHFLTFSTFEKRHLFRDPFLCDLFVHHLKRCRESLPFKLYAFVVMPQHIHLLVHPFEELKISRLLASLKRPVSFHGLEYLKEHHPDSALHLHAKRRGEWIYRFWQHGGGYDRNIYTTEAFRETMQYIHGNPVKARLVAHEEEYRWSSARCWIKGEPKPMEMDVPEWW